MTRVVLDSLTLSKFAVLTDTAEVCDDDGNVVGVFVPRTGSLMDCPLAAEEIENARREPGGRPLKDILSDLEGAS